MRDLIYGAVEVSCRHALTVTIPALLFYTVLCTFLVLPALMGPAPQRRDQE
jgi:hypothetical protein